MHQSFSWRIEGLCVRSARNSILSILMIPIRLFSIVMLSYIYIYIYITNSTLKRDQHYFQNFVISSPLQFKINKKFQGNWKWEWSCSKADPKNWWLPWFGELVSGPCWTLSSNMDCFSDIKICTGLKLIQTSQVTV